jgi:hypothetical protein
VVSDPLGHLVGFAGSEPFEHLNIPGKVVKNMSSWLGLEDWCTPFLATALGQLIKESWS